MNLVRSTWQTSIVSVSKALNRLKYRSLLLYRLKARSSFHVNAPVSLIESNMVVGGRHAGSKTRTLRLPDLIRTTPTTVTEWRGRCKKTGSRDVKWIRSSLLSGTEKYFSMKSRSIDEASLPLNAEPEHVISRLKSKAST